MHVASTGGVWSALVSGFGGFRDHGGARPRPAAPDDWDSLTFRLTLRGSRIRVELVPGALLLEIEDGPEAVAVGARAPGGRHPGSAAAAPMDTHGPERAETPDSPALTGERREDGSKIIASVPAP